MRDLAWTAMGFTCAVVLMAGCNVAQSPVAPANVSGASQGAHGAVVPPRGNHPAEIFNQILPYPHPCQYGTGPCPTDFEVVFKGNVTADIPPNEPLDVHENAFCNPSPPSPNCAPTVTFNSSNDTTTLEWSGPILYQNRASGFPGVHFGLIAGRNFTTSIKALEAASYWTYASAPQGPMPIISINSKQPASSKAWKYAIVYVAGSTTKGSANEYATWNEIAYVPKAGPNASSFQPQLGFANYGSQPIYVSSSGIVLDQPVPTDSECLKTPVCKENLAMLANLQEVNYPPPGQPSSPFIALTHPPPAILKPHK